MSIDEDFARWLRADPQIDGLAKAIVQNRMPATDELPALWYKRRTSDDGGEELDANPNREVQFNETYDVEAISNDLTECLTLAGLVKRKNRYAGSFGNGKCQAAMATDHDDLYVKTNTPGDIGKHVADIEITVTGYE